MLPVFNAGPFIEDHLSERRCHQVAPPIMHDCLLGNSSAKQAPRATVKNHSTSCSYVLNQGIRKIYLLRDSRIPNVPQAFVHVLDPRAIHRRLLRALATQTDDCPFNLVREPDIILVSERKVIALISATFKEGEEAVRSPQPGPLYLAHARTALSPLLNQHITPVRGPVISDRNTSNWERLCFYAL
jgi:hypothetical protein